MTIIITAKNRLTDKVNETCTQVDSVEQARSLHDTHRALFADSDVETFSQYGPLFNSIAVSAKSECKMAQMVRVSDNRNITVGEENKAYWKWFQVSLN